MQDLDRVPRKRRNFHLEEVDGEHILFGRTRAAAHFLNESASAIWNVCDGTRSVREIVQIFSDAYPDSAGEIAQQVPQVIGELAAAGVLAFDDAEAGPLPDGGGAPADPAS